MASSEQKLKSIVENGYDGIILLNRDGRIKYASTRTEKFLGTKPTSLSVQEAINLFPSYRLHLIRLFYTIDKHNVILRLNNKEGQIRFLESSWISRLDDPSINAIIINFHDITRQIAPGNELLAHQITIEREKLLTTVQKFIEMAALN